MERYDLAEYQRDTTAALQQTAVILERIQGEQRAHDSRIKSLEEARDNGTERTYAQLVRRPESERNWILAAVAVVAVIVSCAGLIEPIALHFLK